MGTPAKRSSKQGRQRREAILAAAEDVFAKQGYRGGSLQAIAERVGLSQPGLLHHFPTKENLFVEILDLRQAEDEQRFMQMFAEEDGDFWRAVLESVKHAVQTPGLSRLFTSLASESMDADHPGHAWFINHFRRARAMWTRILIREQEAGRIAPDVDVDLLAAEILGTWDGLALQWELDPGRVDLVAGMSAYLDRVRAQVGSPPASRRRRPRSVATALATDDAP
jgi:AcrR family transcriptional regulator